MNEQQWRAERDNRTLRYAGRVLDPKQWILISADPEYVTRYDGQVAIITAANLIGRMTPSVAIDIPDVQILAPLPWAGHNLREFVLELLREADPYGYFELRSYHSGDYVLRLGTFDTGTIAHGSGWNSYVGPAPSPLALSSDPNPIGPAMAAVIASASLFVNDFKTPDNFISLNCLTWTDEVKEPSAFNIELQPNLGNIWTIGTGSVGTAILYFLSLATTRFSVALFDMDHVMRHNLDRSPIFFEKNVGQHKVEAVKAFLSSVGVTDGICEPYSLDQSQLWRNRQQGTPDVLISTANERNVRAIIEGSFPPVQIYGTTGKNWQASIIRHVPPHDPCSCCLFPDTVHAPTACATANVSLPDGQHNVDAALPFLSFAAGIMAAAEILKLSAPGFPFSANRVILNTAPWPRLVHAPLATLSSCVCQTRSKTVHKKMIMGGRFAIHSGI